MGIALSAIGEGLREAARDFGGASLRCVCLPLSPPGSGHPPHRFITRSREITLSHATLSDAYLPHADLSNAHLVETDLRGANLSHANLSRATLDCHNLRPSGRANLSYANLNNLRGCTKEELRSAFTLKGATMPNGQKYEEWLKDRERQQDE